MEAFTNTKEDKPGQGPPDHGIERLVLHERVALIYRLIAPTLIASVGPVAHPLVGGPPRLPGEIERMARRDPRGDGGAPHPGPRVQEIEGDPRKGLLLGQDVLRRDPCLRASLGLCRQLPFPRRPPALQVLVAAMIIGVGAVGLSTLGTVRPMFISFFVPTTLPFAVYMIYLGSSDYAAVGLAAIAFMGLMVVNSSRISQNVGENISSRLKQAVMDVEIKEANQLLLNEAAEKKQAEEALRESELKYRRMFESLEDLYYQTDERGIIQILSSSLYRLGGWRPEELIGRPVTDVYVDPSDREGLLSPFAEAPVREGL